MDDCECGYEDDDSHLCDDGDIWEETLEYGWVPVEFERCKCKCHKKLRPLRLI